MHIAATARITKHICSHCVSVAVNSEINDSSCMIPFLLVLDSHFDILLCLKLNKTHRQQCILFDCKDISLFKSLCTFWKVYSGQYPICSVPHFTARVIAHQSDTGDALTPVTKPASSENVSEHKWVMPVHLAEDRFTQTHANPCIAGCSLMCHRTSSKCPLSIMPCRAFQFTLSPPSGASHLQKGRWKCLTPVLLITFTFHASIPTPTCRFFLFVLFFSLFYLNGNVLKMNASGSAI